MNSLKNPVLLMCISSEEKERNEVWNVVATSCFNRIYWRFMFSLIAEPGPYVTKKPSPKIGKKMLLRDSFPLVTTYLQQFTTWVGT